MLGTYSAGSSQVLSTTALGDWTVVLIFINSALLKFILEIVSDIAKRVVLCCICQDFSSSKTKVPVFEYMTMTISEVNGRCFEIYY
jgi:hypothetical protein